MRARNFLWRAIALLPAAALIVAACDRSAGPGHAEAAIAGPSFGVGSGLGSAQDTTGGGGGGGPGYRYRYRGAADYADASFYVGGDSMAGGYTSGYLSVSRSSDSSGTAYLYYSIWTCDANWYCYTIEGGSGPIPAGDLRFTRNGAELNTNTSAEANPDFYHYAGSGGTIVVTWSGSGAYTTHSTTSERSQYGGLRVRRRSTSDAFAALAQGTMVSATFADASGSVGSSTNFEFDIER